MKQLIARIDDDLHRRLKERARSEGRSLNDLVVEALQAKEGNPTTTEAVRERAQTASLLADVSAPTDYPDLDELEMLLRGTGAAVSTALETDRGSW